MVVSEVGCTRLEDQLGGRHDRTISRLSAKIAVMP
jgi:hypothetical protein